MEHVWGRHFDRRADERGDQSAIESMLVSPETRVLEWSPQGCWVVDGPEGPRLWLRTAQPADRTRLALFLGRTRGDGSGDPFDGQEGVLPAWVAVVIPAAPEETADSGRHTQTDESAPTLQPYEPSTGGHEAPTADASSAPRRMGLRDIGALLPDGDVEAFMTAEALGQWHVTHTHCPRCGVETEPATAGWTRRCPNDGSEHYPRTDPAVIMAITDPTDRLLLARSPAWPVNRRSVLAGFVEPGERLEAAVAREVLEEVGLSVRDVRYVASQPWPFPASLMLGFTATTDREALTLVDGEIAEAEWYTREQLQRAVSDGSLGLPGPLSIARRLIEAWFGQPLLPPMEVSFHSTEAAKSRSDDVESAEPDGPVEPVIGSAT